mgnify:FL=1
MVQREEFDQEHDELLKKQFGDEFIIPHRVITRVLSPIKEKHK